MQFDFIDPDTPGQAPPPPAAASVRECIGGGDAGAWNGLLTACWTEIAAETGALLTRPNDHEIWAHIGALLNAVNHRLVQLIGEPETGTPCRPLGSIWCAAQALNASVLSWQRLRPAAAPRFGVLVSRLERRMTEQTVPALSTSSVAATSRIASTALHDLILGPGRPEPALHRLEDAAVGLAASSIAAWQDTQLLRRRRGLIDRTVAMHRLAANVGAVAAFEEQGPGTGRDGAGDWLAIAIAREPPAFCLALVDDPRADRVLRADALTAGRAAWVRRGALELLALQRLDHEPNVAALRRLRMPPHAAAAMRAARLPEQKSAAGATVAWRRHSLALARTVATYLRADSAPNPWFRDTREALLELFSDSLAQAATLEAASSPSDSSPNALPA